MIEVVDHHSVRTDLLSCLLSGLPILDVGARGFGFARWFAQRGHSVVAMDPDPGVMDPGIPNVSFMREALVGAPGMRHLVMDPNPEARYIAAIGESTKHPTEFVSSVGIDELMKRLGVSLWDAVKLNCEGEEANILSGWPGPIARQIVVSFHEHYRPIGEEAIQCIVQHLHEIGYATVQHVKDSRYYGGPNYWDSVFALREIV